MAFPDGLKLAVVTKREDERDAFVSEKFASFDELPKGSVVGTTSLRRQMRFNTSPRPKDKILVAM